MPRTGQKCTRAGYYRTQCPHAHTHHFHVGDTFTPCRQCGGPVEWTWVHA